MAVAPSTLRCPRCGELVELTAVTPASPPFSEIRSYLCRPCKKVTALAARREASAGARKGRQGAASAGPQPAPVTKAGRHARSANVHFAAGRGREQAGTSRCRLVLTIDV